MVRTKSAGWLGLAVGVCGASGCAGPNVVDQALYEVRECQQQYLSMELEALADARERKLVGYRSQIEAQESEFEGLVSQNREVKGAIREESAATGQLQQELASARTSGAMVR